jgi:uncharacterized protein
MTCFDRDREAERLWRYFKKGRNVLMLAPRRMGKTVLLERLKEESERNGFRAIVLDVEGYRHEKDFFQQMCASIQEELGAGQAILASLTERLRRVVHGADNLQGDWRNLLLNMDWRLFADHLVAQLEETTDGKTWMFLVDEITIFTKALLDGPAGVTAASDFLYKLRQLCREHPKVRWLFTGSIGLDTIARRHGIEGSLVDLEIFSLEPFSPQTAKDFLQHIGEKNGVTMTDAAVGTICERLGWLSPYYLEKIGEAASEASHGKEVEVEAAHSAADSLLGLAQRTYWSTWREHLDKNFPEPERTRLFTILAEISRGADGASIDTLLLTLNRAAGEPLPEGSLRGYLDTLEADGYVTANAERSRFRFQMNLLREWWVRYVAPPPAGSTSRG